MTVDIFTAIVTSDTCCVAVVVAFKLLLVVVLGMGMSAIVLTVMQEKNMGMPQTPIYGTLCFGILEQCFLPLFPECQLFHHYIDDGFGIGVPVPGSSHSQNEACLQSLQLAFNAASNLKWSFLQHKNSFNFLNVSLNKISALRGASVHVSSKQPWTCTFSYPVTPVIHLVSPEPYDPWNDAALLLAIFWPLYRRSRHFDSDGSSLCLSYGYAGKIRDINVLNMSPLLERMVDGAYHGFIPFNIGSDSFHNCFFLTDGIYPNFQDLSKEFNNQSLHNKRYTLVGKSLPSEFWRAHSNISTDRSSYTGFQRYHIEQQTCVILHNILVSDRIMGDCKAS